MSVDDLARRMGRRQFDKIIAVRTDHGRKVHHLTQTEKQIAPDFLFRFPAAEDCAARFEGRGGHAGRQLQTDIERVNPVEAQTRKRLVHVFRARNAAYVDDLVRVGNNDARAVRHGKRGKFLGRERGTFHMNVRIDKGRQSDQPRGVVYTRRRIPRSHADDRTVLHGKLALFKFARKYVENFCAPNHKIARFALHGAVDEMFHLIFPPFCIITYFAAVFNRIQKENKSFCKTVDNTPPRCDRIKAEG